MGRYVSAGILRGRVPVRALKFPECNLTFNVPAANVFRLPGECIKCSSCELLRVLHKHFRGVIDAHPVLVHDVLDAWAYFSFVDSLYGPNYSGVYFTGWCGRYNVYVADVLFERPSFVPTF